MPSFHDRFTGIFPALATPLDERGKVDEPAVRRLVHHLIDGGASGIWALGSGGEFASLTSDQRRVLLRVACDEARNRVPIVAGISDTCMPRVIEHAAAAADAGASAVFATTPYYFQLTCDEAACYWLDLAGRVKLPLVVYHNPHNARGRIDAAAVKRLADHPNIVGIKDSSCDLGLFQEMLDAVGERDDFRVFQGHDPLMVPGVLLGADGAVLAAALIAPKLVVAVERAARAGDLATVKRLNRDVRRLDALFTIDGPTDSSFLGGQKAALEVMGLCSRFTAPPIPPLDDTKLSLVRRILKDAGLISQ